MTDEGVFQTISRYGVIPIVAIESADAAPPLADALLEGGLAIAEITFRTAAAAEAIERLNRRRPELLLGAGTILTVENLKAAVDCGARFGVAPGLNPKIVQEAQALRLPFVPGVATPSDVERGLSLGCTVLKLFPAAALGGVAMLKALAGPFGHTGVRFIPTGGVNASNLESYLSLSIVTAVGGTWIAKKEDLAAGKWQEIRDRCAQVAQVVARLRG